VYVSYAWRCVEDHFARLCSQRSWDVIRHWSFVGVWGGGVLCVVYCIFFYFVLLQLLRINVIIITALNIYNVICKFINLYAFMLLLLCFYYTVQCIVIRPVCLFVGLCACLCVCGSVTTITRNCVHRSSPNWVCRWR